MQLPLAAQLDAAVKNACPNVAGVSIGRQDDRSTWRINFTDAASSEEIDAAHVIMATFEPSDAPIEDAPAAGEVRVISIDGKPYELVPADALKFTGAFLRALNGGETPIALAGGKTVTVTPDNATDIANQLAGVTQ